MLSTGQPNAHMAITLLPHRATCTLALQLRAYNDIPGDNIGIVSPIVSRGPVSPQFHYDDTLRQLPVQRSPTTQPSSVALLTAQAPSFAF